MIKEIFLQPRCLKGINFLSKGTTPLIWGNSFVTIPRRILEWMFSPDNTGTRLKGLLSLFLWGGCHFADSEITIKGHGVLCKRGEYIASQSKIAEKLGVKTVESALNNLRKEGLIEVERVNKDDRTLASRIRVVGYDDYNKGPVNYPGAKKKSDGATTKKKASSSVEENGEAKEETFDDYVKRKKKEKEGRA